MLSAVHRLSRANKGSPLRGNSLDSRLRTLNWPPCGPTTRTESLISPLGFIAEGRILPPGTIAEAQKLNRRAMRRVAGTTVSLTHFVRRRRIFRTLLLRPDGKQCSRDSAASPCSLVPRTREPSRFPRDPLFATPHLPDAITVGLWAARFWTEHPTCPRVPVAR